jgi:FAD/FMN-containing dehydrogenase
VSAGFTSWGRYPPYPQTGKPCNWRGDIQKRLDGVRAQSTDTLPLGNGRSYGDSCLAASDQVLPLRALDRFIKADWNSGLIRAEAGVTLGELLAVAIPRGWFLPVTPGTMFVTLGGALANDVHGKNHHVSGTFGCHVPRFGLIRSDRPALECSAHGNAELYAATISGLGLTGVIDWVELQLRPIQSSLMDTTQVRFDSLDEFFSISGELDVDHEYSVSWIDCLGVGRSAGRGVYTAGNHAQEGPLDVECKPNLGVPMTPPWSLVNRASLQLFNSAYYRAHRAGRHCRQVGYGSFFYPLDRILNWNRIYGPRGFQQYQCVMPHAVAVDAVRELLDAIATARSGSFLAVLKRFGDARSPGLLSFPMPGVTLALDFSQQGDVTKRLFARMDEIVRTAGGRLYPAKDAHMSGEDFRSAFPAWERLEALRDPALLSRFWQRAIEM